MDKGSTLMNRLDQYKNTATSEIFFGDPNPFQVKLNYGALTLSIVKHTGSYGGTNGLYEIGVWNKDGQMVEIDGITEEGDTIKGFLDKDEVDGIIIKMFTLTGKDPVQDMGDA